MNDDTRFGLSEVNSKELWMCTCGERKQTESVTTMVQFITSVYHAQVTATVAVFSVVTQAASHARIYIKLPRLPVSSPVQ